MFLECVTFLTSRPTRTNLVPTNSNPLSPISATAEGKKRRRISKKNRVTISPSPVVPLLFILLQLIIIPCVFGDESQFYNEEFPRSHFRGDSDSPVFLNEWAVHVPGGLEVAQQVANNHGYLIERAIPPLDDYYLLKHRQSPRRSRRSIQHLTKRLSDDHRVLWVEQQAIKRRDKRGLHHSLYKKDAFTDPLWEKEWYLRDQRSKFDDLNVIPCWARNITGNNIVITILDDGIEHTHSDLKANYDPKASTDLNDHDPDPFPRYDPTNENKHGTRCAGEIAMRPNNGYCGVGVAFNTKIGGVRFLDGPLTDMVEAMAIGFNHKYIDIYSASWGPVDNGETLDGPGKMASQAFEKGIKEGRDGKGSIYVWASGNGGLHDDNCDCDGYAASIYTISVTSVTSKMDKPWYTEMCASIMASTFSGSLINTGVVSADLHNKCTTAHSGTSASAPIAAGIIALLLESNPELTWRDVQHLVVWTSNPEGLRKNRGWKQNAAGFWVNSRFGFGLLNAIGLVDAADPRRWRPVPKQRLCRTSYTGIPRQLRSGKEVSIEINTDACRGTYNETNFLEHVQIIIDVEHNNRGVLEITVISPAGTETSLLRGRPKDKSTDGITNWAFMSVHTWGEDPSGTWTIIIRDKGSDTNSSGVLKKATLRMYGTVNPPDHVVRAGGRRHYHAKMKDTFHQIILKPDDPLKDVNLDLAEKLFASIQLKKNRQRQRWLTELERQEEPQKDFNDFYDQVFLV